MTSDGARRQAAGVQSAGQQADIVDADIRAGADAHLLGESAQVAPVGGNGMRRRAALHLQMGKESSDVALKRRFLFRIHAIGVLAEVVYYSSSRMSVRTSTSPRNVR